MSVSPKILLNLSIVFIALLGNIAQPCRAQVNDIFKAKTNGQLFTLWHYVEDNVFHNGDSANNFKILDSIISIAQSSGNEELLWHGQYLKSLYTASVIKEPQATDTLNSMQDFVNRSPYPLLRAIYKSQLGNALATNRQYSEGLNLMLQAEQSLEQIGLENVPNVSEYLDNLVNYYYHVYDYKNALKYIKLSERYPDYFPAYHISIVNTEGMAYRKLSDYANAKSCFLRAIDTAKKFNDQVWVGIAAGNYGAVLDMEGDYKNAIRYLLMDYSFNHIGLQSNTALTDLRLADCYTHLAKLDSAKFYLTAASSMSGADPDPSYKRSYFRALSEYYNANNQPELAYRYIDSATKISDTLDIQSSRNIIESTEKRIQTEKYLTEKALDEEKQKDKLIIRNIIFVSLVVVLLLVLILLYGRHRSSVQKQQLLQAEKKVAEERLQHAETELNNYIKNLSQKSELIIKATAELEDLQKDIEAVIPPEKLETLSTLFKFTILTNDDWEEFKRLFDVVHPHFFTVLRNSYSSLTPAETRLLALLKLKLANKEIAAMIGVSPDTITRTKHRLRKKLIEINIQEELEQFVEEL